MLTLPTLQFPTRIRLLPTPSMTTTTSTTDAKLSLTETSTESSRFFTTTLTSPSPTWNTLVYQWYITISSPDFGLMIVSLGLLKSLSSLLFAWTQPRTTRTLDTSTLLTSQETHSSPGRCTGICQGFQPSRILNDELDIVLLLQLPTSWWTFEPSLEQILSSSLLIIGMKPCPVLNPRVKVFFQDTTQQISHFFLDYLDQ